MKQLLVILMFLCSASIFAQDVIVKKDGSHIECRVVEVNDSGVVYKKWSNLNGNNFEIDRADVSAINYQSGKKEDYSEVNNLYKPGNQNDGTQQVNDIELIRMDLATHNPLKKAKTLKTIGWISGSILSVCGILLISDVGDIIHGAPDSERIVGVCLLGVGVAGVTSSLLVANHIQKKADSMLQSNSIWQKEIKFKNGSSLSTGVDMLNDNVMGNSTIGLGFRYNF
ncbi:MAG: hypothetical protein J5867_10045 [Prevotella sp.]|nr:hypothetical protein [Prevotella sp.]